MSTSSAPWIGRDRTQVELAAALSMDQSLLSRYERGALRLHGALVADLARVLHVITDEILGVAAPRPGCELF